LGSPKTSNREGWLRPIIGMAIFSLLLCGLFFPLLITGVAQVALPYQANGEVVQFNGRPAGSELIAQTFNQTAFFQPRNDSASGVDPDITVQDAYSQIPRISNATDIPASTLRQLVDSKTDAVSRIFGDPYVNVLDLNLALIQMFPSTYSAYH
jgi:potassium-transporting ATPase KdpC subunit